MKCPFCDYDESKVVDSRPAAKPETKTTSGAGEFAIPGFLSNED